MSLPLVIINPESAGGRTRDAWPTMASDLRTHFGAFNCTFTSQMGEGTELAAEAARKGTKLIVACGGDGTIAEVANGILASGKDAELGILPSGTGGDFRRTLGIPARISDAAEILRSGRTLTIDVGRVTFVDHDGNQAAKYFLGVASLGMSAEVIKRVKASESAWLPTKTPKWLGGRVSFGMSMLQTAMQLPATRVIVQIDDLSERNLTVANLCVANARYFGGGMKIAPAAMLNDGKLDVVYIGELGASKILMNAPRLYSGTHLNMEQVGHALAKKIAARPTASKAQVAIEVDGELVGRLPAAFQIVPKALRLRCPR
jgi:YegS/Rv2252/BmrU family lipid kinase